MATYTELFDLRSNNALRNKIAVAVIEKARILIDLATPTAKQLAWAEAAISNPLGKADTLMNYVLVANKSATTAQILAANDAAIQNNVNAAVDKLTA
jgi:hypothetical protein